ncbi:MULTISPECIES: NinE family protein, partial [Enterobacteriaceae]
MTDIICENCKYLPT